MKFAYFVLGVALPILGITVWAKDLFGVRKHGAVDKAHDITVEDSFPASDPPSSW